MPKPVQTIIAGAVALVLTGALATTAGAAGWKWAKPYSVAAFKGGVDGLTCPSAGLCIGIGANQVLWTTSPASKSAWQSAALEPLTSPYVQGGDIGLTGITCPSATDCVAVDNIGNAFTTSNPTGGAGAWSEQSVDSTQLEAISCSSGALCAALDYNGDALGLSGGGQLLPGATASADFYGVSCAGTSFCVAAEAKPELWVGASTQWTKLSLPGDDLDTVSCASAVLCVAAGGYDSPDGSARIAVSKTPATSWKSITLRHVSPGFNQITCTSASFCAAIAGVGVYTSTKPAASASAWKFTKVPGTASETALSCPTTSLCVVGTSTDQIAVGRR